VGRGSSTARKAYLKKDCFEVKKECTLRNQCSKREKDLFEGGKKGKLFNSELGPRGETFQKVPFLQRRKKQRF